MFSVDEPQPEIFPIPNCFCLEPESEYSINLLEELVQGCVKGDRRFPAAYRPALSIINLRRVLPRLPYSEIQKTRLFEYLSPGPVYFLIDRVTFLSKGIRIIYELYKESCTCIKTFHKLDREYNRLKDILGSRQSILVLKRREISNTSRLSKASYRGKLRSIRNHIKQVIFEARSYQDLLRTEIDYLWEKTYGCKQIREFINHYNSVKETKT